MSKAKRKKGTHSGVEQVKRATGWKWRFYGSYKGRKFTSPAIYDTDAEALVAREEKLKELAYQEGAKSNLFHLARERVLDLQLERSMKYAKESEEYLEKAKAEWGDVPVQSITKAQAKRLLNKEARRLQKAGKQNYGANALLRCLKSFFQYAIDYHDIVMPNPMKGIPQFSIDKEDKFIPTGYDVWHIKEFYLTEKQRELVEFVEETGCRIGEALRFTVDDIDYSRDQIILRTRKARHSDLTPRRIPKPKCLAMIDLPKSGKVFSTWSTYPTFLKVAVKKAIAEYDESMANDGEGIVFWDKKDLRLLPWCWHNLRHKAASEWADSGMPLIQIMNRLGHTNIGTTQIYLRALGFDEY
jgi:integrase